MIISRYQGGNTRHKIKVKVGLVYWSIEDNCFNLSEKWDQRRTIMVGTTIAKGQIPDIRWTYTKGIINLREALMIRSTSCPWAWTQSSRSTPTSSMYNLPFTSRFDKGISVESFTWWNTRWVRLVKTSEFTHIKEGIGSTRQGIVEIYTTNFNSKYHQLESRAWLAKQMIQFTKGIMYPRKGSQGYWIWRALSDKIQQRIWWSTRDLTWASVLN